MNKTKRNTIKMIFAGLVAGILAGIVKLGWEAILPPRTPSRNATNPPQELLQQLGIPSNITHLTYQFSEQ